MMPDKKIKQILREQNLAPQKRLGQNFLINGNIAEKIVSLAGIRPDDTILEVGVGFGALTTRLAPRCKKVIGLEVDSGIIRYHKQEDTLPANVQLIHRDVLQADFTALAKQSGGQIKLIANLPYSISNPLLFKLARERDNMAWAVLMLQKEVAQRLTAETGTKNYGILTVRLSACAFVTKLLDLGPQHFHPRPKVDSQVVKITFSPKPERAAALPDYDETLFRNLIEAAFQQRRKTLVNALAASKLVNLDKTVITAELTALGLDTKIRGERLSVEDFVSLTNALQKKSPN